LPSRSFCSHHARLPTGSDYDQQVLLDAQQRLASSGYYDSVFLTLDTEGTDPQAVPVIAQVRDAPLQKVVVGVGFTTDNGARLSLDHTHNQMPLLGWRAVSRLVLAQKTQSLGTQWTGVPGEGGWRWFTGAQVKRDTSGDYEVNSARVRGGMSTSTDHIDRSYFLQYDNAQNKGLYEPLGETFARQGIGTAVINYRLTDSKGTVKHPDHIRDVAKAFAWLKH